MRRPLAWLALVTVVTVGVLLLRAELMTVEVETPEGSFTDVVVAADVKQEDDPEAVREEMTRGLVSTCRLLVNADVVAESFRVVEPGVFAFRLRPGLDEFDVRELRGCLSDTRVQHLLVDVLHLQTVTPADEWTRATGDTPGSARPTGAGTPRREPGVDPGSAHPHLWR